MQYRHCRALVCGTDCQRRSVDTVERWYAGLTVRGTVDRGGRELRAISRVGQRKKYGFSVHPNYELLLNKGDLSVCGADV
jgi:hypothetical protein